jgi:hypothetical protein
MVLGPSPASVPTNQALSLRPRNAYVLQEERNDLSEL